MASETIWAFIDGDTVVNTFVGDPEQVQPLLDADDRIVNVTDANPVPSPGWTAMPDGSFCPLYERPYPSWVWHGPDGWRAPIARPEGDGEYRWDEDAQVWVARDTNG